MQETQETWVQFLNQETLLEKEMASHFSIPAWENPMGEEPGGLQPMGSQRVRHMWAHACTYTEAGPFLLGLSHGFHFRQMWNCHQDRIPMDCFSSFHPYHSVFVIIHQTCHSEPVSISIDMNISIYLSVCLSMCFPNGSGGKGSACNSGEPGSFSGLGRSSGEGNGNPSGTLAWRIPWTEKSGGLQSTGSQRVRHDGILQARILVQVAMPSCWDLPYPGIKSMSLSSNLH